MPNQYLLSTQYTRSDDSASRSNSQPESSAMLLLPRFTRVATLQFVACVCSEAECLFRADSGRQWSNNLDLKNRTKEAVSANYVVHSARSRLPRHLALRSAEQQLLNNAHQNKNAFHASREKVRPLFFSLIICDFYKARACC